MNKRKTKVMDIEEIINKTAKAAAREVLEQSREKQQKEMQLGSFKKTEKILYEYPRWKNTDVKETARFCNMIETALESVSSDPYYKIIELKYFQKWTHERIAEYFGVDVSVISKRRIKIINTLRPILFSAEFIKELYENT